MDEYAIRRYVATSQQANHDSPENVENLQRKSHHKMTGAHHSIQSAVCPRFLHYAGIVLRYTATCYHHNDCPTCFVNGNGVWHRSSVGFTFVFSPWQSFQASLSSAHLA